MPNDQLKTSGLDEALHLLRIARDELFENALRRGPKRGAIYAKDHIEPIDKFLTEHGAL